MWRAQACAHGRESSGFPGRSGGIAEQTAMSLRHRARIAGPASAAMAALSMPPLRNSPTG
ncbi:MAG: hypothetical protein WDM81_20560 [Rhizomicrobium sp.]